MNIDYNEVETILMQKKQEEQIKEESGLRYYNFPILSLIERIKSDNTLSQEEDKLSLTKMFAGFFELDLQLNNTTITKDTRITLDDYKKVNKKLSEVEKNLNDNIQTNGVLYLARNENDFSIMYYEILN